MNTQINLLEIPLKGTATQLFIRTSTDGIYNPTGMILAGTKRRRKRIDSRQYSAYSGRSRSVGRFYGLHRKSCIKTVKFDVKIANV